MAGWAGLLACVLEVSAWPGAEGDPRVTGAGKFARWLLALL